MDHLKSAKLYFCFAVLLLVAKPFLGFGMFSRNHPPADENIFVKAFTKRKQEYAEDSNADIISVQKKLADPIKQFFLRFDFLLGILFPAIFSTVKSAASNFLRKLNQSLSPPDDAYLLNGILII
ncbi:hypothetical protein [Mucilaginibacter sp.]|uniref:hypothetical protein n=1 Tax=Mucilaginibacter sp. TaxID=1882438 RepID=UPI003D136CD0